MSKIRIFFCTPLILLCFCLSSCALGLRFGGEDEDPRETMPHFEEAQLEGLSGLSTRDPYAEQNERFSEYLRTSPRVLEFVQLRGAPAAYAQHEQGLFRREVVYLFYPYEREYFIAEGSREAAKVRGPVRIPDTMLSAIRVATRHENGDVQLSVLDESLAYDGGSPGALNPGQERTFQENFPVHEKEIFEEPEAHAPDPKLIEQNARLKGLVQRLAGGPDLPRDGGDLMHVVQYSQETPAVLAAWYGVRVDHEGRLARILGLQPDDLLPMGMQVRIPSYLVENSKELSEEAAEAVYALLAGSTFSQGKQGL